MIQKVTDKRTVFVLGAGASCPYGYPSGARLRERICLPQGFWQGYLPYLQKNESVLNISEKDIRQFIDAFAKSSIRSIDMFMVNNPKLAPVGKYIIAFEIFRAEGQSYFGEEAKLEKEQIAYAQSHGKRGPLDSFSLPLFIGEDWYSYLYNRLMEGRVGKDALPDFSNGNLAFITFNYDRSLEHFLYEGLCNLFTEVLDDKIVQYFKQLKVLFTNGQIAPQNRELLIQLVLEQLKILHVYGQIAPLKWQDSNKGVDYKPQQISESLLQSASSNIRTIYEEKQNPELIEAQNLLKQAEQIFFLGFGYAPENMEVIGLPGTIPPGNCRVYGTAFGLNDKEVERICNRIIEGLRPNSRGSKYESRIMIKGMDCLELLRNYLE